MTARTRLMLALKALISLALLGAILASVDLGAILARLDIALAPAIMAALVALQIQAVGAGLRWSLVLAAHEASLPFGVVWRNVLLGLFGNQAMPSTIGGDALRVWNGWRQGLRIGLATRTLVVDRVFSFLGLIALCAMALPTLSRQAANPVVLGGVWTLILGGLACLGILLALAAVPARWRDARLLGPPVALSRSAWRVLTDRRRVGPVSVLMLLPHLIDITVIWLYAQALGADVPWSALALVVPAATLTAAVPVSVAGWGLREGALVLGFGVIGLPSDLALACSVLYGLSAVATGLIGALVWSITDPDGLPTLKRADRDLSLAREDPPP